MPPGFKIESDENGVYCNCGRSFRVYAAFTSNFLEKIGKWVWMTHCERCEDDQDRALWASCSNREDFLSDIGGKLQYDIVDLDDDPDVVMASYEYCLLTTQIREIK